MIDLPHSHDLAAPKNQRLKFLDALRGIAALLVACMHFQTLIYERSTASFPFIIDVIFKYGHIGVNIFFVLSGFVIAYSIRQQVISFAFIGSFFLRRSIRLDLPYWTALILFTGVVLMGPLLFNKGETYVPTLNEFLLNAFYLQNFFQVPNILPIAWTLCLEIQFYLVFILLVKMIQDLNHANGLTQFKYDSLWSVSILGSLFLISLTYGMNENSLPLIPGLFLPWWYSFFMGSLICWNLISYLRDDYMWTAFSLMGLCALVGQNGDMGITLCVAGIIFWCGKKQKLHSALNHRILQHLGKISYSLYLIHWLVGIKLISFLSYLLGPHFKTLPALGILALSLGVTLIMTELFYRCVEKPALELSKHIAQGIFKYATTSLHRVASFWIS